MDNKTDKPYSLQISDLLDNILPADGVGTERERLRMTLHTEISKATEEIRNDFDEAVESNENLRKEMEGLIEIHHLQSEEFLSELTQVTGEKEELRKENEALKEILKTKTISNLIEKEVILESEIKRLKESNKELVEALVDLIKVTSCYRVGEIKETLYLVEQKTFLKAEKLIQKSEGDLLKVIIDKSKELDAEQKSHMVTNTDQLRINAIGKSEGSAVTMRA